MKNFKKALRLLCVVMLCILGSLGVGIGGGAVIPVFRSREEKPVNIELVEEESGAKN